MIIKEQITCDDCGEKFTVEYSGDYETKEDGMWLNSCAVCGLVLCPCCFNKHTFGDCAREGETRED